ncbi:MAG: MarR family transcriptional regulator [Gemmatimonadetes bacterium]|nr:MarR family transcriptional regulator [Gemmatimonadota bacterium]
METLPPGLVPHKGLRGQVLLELKRHQPLTAKELADRHSVSPTAVRRHLKELELEQLVVYRREQRGQGAPTFAYRLTTDGEALFPKRYEEALTAALEFVERHGGREAVRRFFAEHFGEEAEKLKARLGEASLEERLAAVAELLSRQGFMAEWATDGAGVRIAEHNCAMHAVAERFPEVCHEELEFLKQVLGRDVERKSHIVAGCNACEYSVGLVQLADPRRAPMAPQEQA